MRFIDSEGYATGEVVRAMQRLGRFPHVFLDESSNRRIDTAGLKLDAKHRVVNDGTARAMRLHVHINPKPPPGSFSTSSIEELGVVLHWLPSKMSGHAGRNKNEQFEKSQALRWVGSNFRSPLPNAHRARNRPKRKLRSPVPRDQPPLTFGYSSATFYFLLRS